MPEDDDYEAGLFEQWGIIGTFPTSSSWALSNESLGGIIVGIVAVTLALFTLCYCCQQKKQLPIRAVAYVVPVDQTSSMKGSQ
jgi:hypothetical protein